MMTPHDAVHDVCLTALGYVPYWLHYDIIGVAERAGTPEVFTGFYDNLKDLPTPDGTWGDWLPGGDPATNWDQWEEAALQFLSAPDAYLDALGPIPGGDWAACMAVAKDRLPQYHRDVAVPLDLCPVYDQVWPKVLGNLRTMTVDATVDADTVAKVRQQRGGLDYPLPFSIVRQRIESGEITLCPSCEQPTDLYRPLTGVDFDTYLANYPMKEPRYG